MNLNILAKLMTSMWKKLKKNPLDLKLGKIAVINYIFRLFWVVTMK